MQEVYKFIASHYELIGSAIVFIISLVFLILKKRPLGNVYSFLIRHCIEGVILAEEHPVKGAEKKQLAIDYVHECLLCEYPEIKVKTYDSFISDIIEIILSTPQKKGD